MDHWFTEWRIVNEDRRGEAPRPGWQSGQATTVPYTKPRGEGGQLLAMYHKSGTAGGAESWPLRGVWSRPTAPRFATQMLQ